MSNPITRPDWYTQYTPEVRYVAAHFGFNLGNTIKYLCRAGTKTPNPTNDLRKAAEYIKYEVEWLAAVGSEDGTPSSDDETAAIQAVAEDLANALGMFDQHPALPGIKRLEWAAEWLTKASSLDDFTRALLDWDEARRHAAE